MHLSLGAGCNLEILPATSPCFLPPFSQMTGLWDLRMQENVRDWVTYPEESVCIKYKHNTIPLRTQGCQKNKGTEMQNYTSSQSGLD